MAMMNFDNKEMREEFHTAFGKEVEELTVAQLWWLTKFSKHVRGRCRSNAAFNNYMNRNFTNAVFRTVEKEGPNGPYNGLEITEKYVKVKKDEDA